MAAQSSKTGYKKDWLIVSEEHQKTFVLYRLSDYNHLISLLKEHSIAVLHIKTAESHLIEGGTIYRVTAQGDKNHLDFVNYLLKKEQDKTQEIIAKTGIDKK